VAALATVGVFSVLSSVVRTVVLPRAVPARLARAVFILVRTLLRLRIALTRGRDYRTRDRVFALQAPLGLFGQLLAWGLLVWVFFALVFWSLPETALTGAGFVQALKISGSSMLTLGFERPHSFSGELTAFADAAVGLFLLALVITYLPSLYGAFSRREALITKLAVRAGKLPSGPALLVRSWELGRFEQLEEVWDAWEDWFIDLGETHTTFPQLGFFRSPHPENHWVLAAEAVLDGAALLIAACDLPRQSRSELCLEAGVGALSAIADFLGIPHRPEESGAEIVLTQEQFDEAYDQLAELEVPLMDREVGWQEFSRTRTRYEHLIAVLGRMTDSPRSSWSSWSEDAPRHSPPLLRLGQH